jgi:RNA methyltransferase, TrmH family
MIVKSKVKYINSLGDKKLRDADGVFVAEGPKIINELLGESRAEAVEIFALKEWIDENGTTSAPVQEIDDIMLGRLSFLTTPNKVLGVFKIPQLPALTFKGQLTLVLDGIQDPGNLGTIIRCADWFGISQVVCSADCADVYNPKTVQSTMGSIARVNVYYEDLAQLLSHADVKVYATSLAGKDVFDIQRLNEGVIIIGNESKGIRESVVGLAHERITIPRIGKAESLNAAVATGIILSAICPFPSRSRS